MKVLCKEVDVIVFVSKDGKMKPLRIRLSNEEDEEQVIKINNILKIESEKLAGNRMEKYTCCSVIRNTSRIFELKYELDTHKWYLYKM
ncbi:MAG: hypothetical protein ACLS2V_11740 [Clostridium paraputrificum]